MNDLERYLHEQIPLSAAMGVQVREATPDRVRLWAPIEPNLNHRNTLFGGSAASVAILAAWTLLYVRCRDEALSARLVIQRAEVDYDTAVDADFEALCLAPDPAEWDRFRRTLLRHGKARISLTSTLTQNGRVATRHVGSFVALGLPAPAP